MVLSYRDELLESTDNTKFVEDENIYVVTCPWCNESFRSEDFLEAVNKEGVHRSKKHIQEEGKIPKPKNGRKKKTSIVDEWINKLDKNQGDNDPNISGLKTVFQIARINYQKQEKI